SDTDYSRAASVSERSFTFFEQTLPYGRLGATLQEESQMRWSQTLIPTQKENPADAQIVSHQLMLRAGLIRQLTAGAYDFLPLGLRSLKKAEQIVREEMNAIGAAEVYLPALQPVELWQRSGRDVAYGENLMKFKDRHGRVNVLGPTHEEVITEMVGAY